MPTIWTSAAAAHEFKLVRSQIMERLLETEPFSAGTWQQLNVSHSRAHDTYEIQHLTFFYPMPESLTQAQEYIDPDLPWAEGHFLERVAGQPVNPGDWHHLWPYHAGRVDLHQSSAGKYEHNYMERFWPKYAGQGWREGDQGYRYSIGDLQDVVNLLIEHPATRQAYLPVWFPEDTGVVEGQRVPCTLGYHFLIREDQLHISYHLRSCEAYRHFTNDVYMAVRLAQWVVAQWNHYAALTGSTRRLTPGNLHLTAASFHGFVGDTDKIEAMIGEE